MGNTDQTSNLQTGNLNLQIGNLKDEYEIHKRKKASLKTADFTSMKHSVPLLAHNRNSNNFHPVQTKISPGEQDSFNMDTHDIVSSNTQRSDDLPWLFRVAMIKKAMTLKKNVPYYLIVTMVRVQLFMGHNDKARKIVKNYTIHNSSHQDGWIGLASYDRKT